MIAEYQNPEYIEWRQVASDIVTINDFRTNRRMRFGGYDVLPAVAEAGPYTGLTSPTDEEATYAIGKKGGTENITMEMIANDDVGAIRRIPLKLALAAKITLYRDIFDIFTANAATTYDSVALFELANHKNIGSSALAQASLTATRQLMRDQAGYNDAKNILGIVPKTLLVPNELEEMAMLLTRIGWDHPRRRFRCGLQPGRGALLLRPGAQTHRGIGRRLHGRGRDQPGNASGVGGQKAGIHPGGQAETTTGGQD
jgi:hypothetical protein